MTVEWMSPDSPPPTGVSVLVTLAIPDTEVRTVSERWYHHGRGWQCIHAGDNEHSWAVLAWCYKPHPWAGKWI